MRSGEAPLGLTLLAGGVAAAVVLPLGWLVATALGTGVDGLATLARPDSVAVLVNSALAVTLVTGFSIALGVPLAYLVARTDLPFRRFWTVAVSLPLVIPSYIGAFAFVSAFGPRGEFHDLLAPVGISSLPSIYGLEGTVLVLTLYTYPYVFFSTRAALKTADTRQVDAARTLGESRYSAFRRVVVPQIRPAVAAGSLLVALYALSDFGTPSLMRYEVFTRVIYINRYDLGFSAVLSLQLLAVAAFVLALESKVRGAERQTAGRVRSSRVGLGWARWPATLLPAAVAGIAIVVPVGVLALWLVRAGPAGTALDPQLVVNSVGVAAAAAAVATVACLPVAYLAATHRSRLAALFERATYLGYATPGVVLGLAVVFVGARYLPWLYPSLALLVFAYVVRFLPQAVGATRAGFLRVDPELPAAARTLGRSPVGAFRTVTLPLVAPSLLAGGALVFLTAMKELPATLLLRPSGFETLVTAIWRAERAGFFGEAALPALVLVIVSGLSLLFPLAREGYDGE